MNEEALRVDVKIWRPRPTARILQSPREAASAMDFDAIVEVSSYMRGRRGNLERSYEGEVTLHEEGRGWRPCRSMQGDPELGWMHGGLLQAVDEIRRDARPIGLDVARRLVEALSGAGWPAFAGPACSESMLELARDAVIPGDVVQHAGSQRTGAVLAVGRIHPDRTVEYLVRPSVRPDRDEDADETWWNSAHARRISHRTRCDPYRRYLAMASAEDDPAGRVRRSRHRCAKHGDNLPRGVWDKMYWRLSNLQRVGLDGQLTYVNLGREHWTAAAHDCLRRRERSERVSWMSAQERAEEAHPVNAPGGRRVDHA